MGRAIVTFLGKECKTTIFSLRHFHQIEGSVASGDGLFCYFLLKMTGTRKFVVAHFVFSNPSIVILSDK